MTTVLTTMILVAAVAIVVTFAAGAVIGIVQTISDLS